MSIIVMPHNYYVKLSQIYGDFNFPGLDLSPPPPLEPRDNGNYYLC